MFDKSKPMDIGDIFSNTFKLFTATFSRNIIIAAVFLIPSGIIAVYGFDSFFSGIIEFARNTVKNKNDNANLDLFINLIKNFTTYFFSLLIFSLGNLCAIIGITKISDGAINGDNLNIGDAFNKVFSKIFWKSIAQVLLLLLASFACVFVGIIIIAFGASTDIIILTIIGIFALIAGILFLIYLTFRWYFAFIAIVVEDKGVIESFSKSSFLVQGFWWRTFGIIIMISVLVDFAVSIISTPLSFIFLWDFISEYFKMISQGRMNNNDPVIIFKMMESFGFAFGAIIVLTTLLDILITPLFNLVLYYDLKIRKNDFTDVNVHNNLISGEPSL